MAKLYVIKDTPLFGVSRKDRRRALRREQSGDEIPPPPPLPPRDPATALPAGVISPPTRTSASTTGPAAPAGQPRIWGLPAAYLLGPLLVARWTEGSARLRWSVIGGGAALAAAALVVRWTEFLGWTAVTVNGSAVWLATIGLVSVAGFAAWGHAIGAAAEKRPVSRPSRLQNSRLVLLFGLLLPGLGHIVARRPRTAARTFTLLGPFTAAAAVLANARWLWAVHRGGSLGALAPNALESTFVAAAVVLLITGLAWIGAALHASRLVGGERRWVRTTPVAAVIVIAIVLVGAAHIERSLARGLHDASTRLRHDGLRVIPLALCGMAAHLDPSRPSYLADIVALNESLGRGPAARDARASLRRRAAEFSDASHRTRIPVVLEADATGGTAVGSAFSRLQKLSGPWSPEEGRGSTTRAPRSAPSVPRVSPP